MTGTPLTVRPPESQTNAPQRVPSPLFEDSLSLYRSTNECQMQIDGILQNCASVSPESLAAEAAYGNEKVKYNFRHRLPGRVLSVYIPGAIPNGTGEMSGIYDKDAKLPPPLYSEGGPVGGYWIYLNVSWNLNQQTKDPYGRIPLVKKLRSKEKLSQEDCDTYLAKIFGDGSSVIATKNEPRGVGQDRKNPTSPGMDYEGHLGNNGVFHMYANDHGTKPNISRGQGKMYIPYGGSLINPTAGTFAETSRDPDTGVKTPTGGYSNEFIFNYSGGLTIKVFHVGGTTGNYLGADKQVIGENVLQPDKNDTNTFGYRIGYVGGLGGYGSRDYIHSHWEFNVNGKRVDPRKLFCNW